MLFWYGFVPQQREGKHQCHHQRCQQLYPARMGFAGGFRAASSANTLHPLAPKVPWLPETAGAEQGALGMSAGQHSNSGVEKGAGENLPPAARAVRALQPCREGHRAAAELEGMEEISEPFEGCHQCPGETLQPWQPHQQPAAADTRMARFKIQQLLLPPSPS